MINRVKNMRQGVCSPIRELPLVRGLLIVASSISGLALLDYASLINF